MTEGEMRFRAGFGATLVKRFQPTPHDAGNELDGFPLYPFAVDMNPFCETGVGG